MESTFRGSTSQKYSQLTLRVQKELRQVEKLWNELLHVSGRLRRGQPPGGGQVSECPVGNIEALALEGEEHGSEGREPHQEVKDDATVGVVGAIVVWLGGVVGETGRRAV